MAIKILINDKYRIKLGKEARNAMKKFNNMILLKKWVKLIISIYKGDNSYEKLRNQDKKISIKDALRIIKNQVKLLKKRNKKFKNLTFKDIQNFSFMKNLK